MRSVIIAGVVRIGYPLRTVKIDLDVVSVKLDADLVILRRVVRMGRGRECGGISAKLRERRPVRHPVKRKDAPCRADPCPPHGVPRLPGLVHPEVKVRVIGRARKI